MSDLIPRDEALRVLEEQAQEFSTRAFDQEQFALRGKMGDTVDPVWYRGCAAGLMRAIDAIRAIPARRCDGCGYWHREPDAFFGGIGFCARHSKFHFPPDHSCAAWQPRDAR